MCYFVRIVQRQGGAGVARRRDSAGIIGCHGDDPRVFRPQGGLAERRPEDFDARYVVGAKSLDEHEVARGEPAGERIEIGRACRRFAKQGPALAAGDEDLGGAGLPVAKAVLAWLVELQVVMCVLDGGDGEAGAGEAGEDGAEQRGFAAARPSGQAEQKGFQCGTASGRPRAVFSRSTVGMAGPRCWSGGAAKDGTAWRRPAIR